MERGWAGIAKTILKVAVLLALGCGEMLPKYASEPCAGTPPLPADTSRPTSVVGDGTAASCTAAAFEAAVHGGGIVTFNCGSAPVTIELDREIKILNNAGPNQNGDLVIDGGGKITLSGRGQRRILYQNTCDQDLVWLTSRCDLQDHPRLTVQNLKFVDGFAQEADKGGGAIFVRGGLLTVIDCTFENNQCAQTGPDVAGGAIYTLDQSGPVRITKSVFGGAPDKGNVGSNGGALGTIGASYTLWDSVLSYNRAVGTGRNPATNGIGGGSGGAIYTDGNTYTLGICSSEISNNSANELGGAVFFVSNDRTGTLRIDRSTSRANTGTDVQDLPGFFVLGHRSVTSSVIE